MTAAALWFGIPLASLLAALAFLLAPSRSGDTQPSDSRAEPASVIEGWTGQRELADGTRLVARLVPLHAETERQRFDARALAARLGLSPGEPWRLDLRRLHAAPGRHAGPARTGDRAVPDVDLRAVRVSDGRGTALVAIADASAGAIDPLRTLLAPPVEPLSAGLGVELVLWGRVPSDRGDLESGVRLEGLADGALALERAAIPSADVPTALARQVRTDRAMAAATSADNTADDAAPADNDE